MTDVTHELARQVVNRGEDPAGDHIAFDAAEPEFDLIEPRGIGRSKMQVQLGMIGQELCDPLGLMRRQQFPPAFGARNVAGAQPGRPQTPSDSLCTGAIIE
jgi:hypothetical protein